LGGNNLTSHSSRQSALSQSVHAHGLRHHHPQLNGMETTLLLVEALWQFERSADKPPTRIAKARLKGWSRLLERHLGLGSGAPLKRQWASFSFPPYWFYDYLTALDCLRDSAGRPDRAAQQAIDLVRARRRQDGTWRRGAKHAGKTHFEMESAGGPSRWNTLRAMRVLDWWAESSAERA